MSVLTQQFYCHFASESQTQAFAQELLQLLIPVTQEKCTLVYLLGDLGTGKSTFSRALIRASGYQGNIPSPTYSIQETYTNVECPITIHHLDLYRLSDFLELEMLGFYDNLVAGSMFLIEWPQLVQDHYQSLLTLEFQHQLGQDEVRTLTLTVTPSELPTTVNAPSWLTQVANLTTKYQ